MRVQTSHITPEQAGPVLDSIRPRLAAVHHLTVNDASRVAIVSGIRAGYPQGVSLISLNLFATLLLASLWPWTAQSLLWGHERSSVEQEGGCIS